MQWFERPNQFLNSDPLPDYMLRQKKLSLVRLYDNGKTQPGWGSKDFMLNQKHNAFDPERALKFYHKYGQPFGIVMRSVPYITVDIDGKNGGIKTANALQLDLTGGETSKSENGFHLLYDVPGTKWDPLLGYNEFPDIIGLIPGVDIKSTGVVYHYHNQRWNDREPAPLPNSLSKLITRARDIRHQARVMKSGIQNMDPDDLVLLWDTLTTQLSRRIQIGKRNQVLYALGCRMYVAGVPNWADLVTERGINLGLPEDEMDALIRNIETYA